MSKAKSWMAGFLVSATMVPAWVLSNNGDLMPANTSRNTSPNINITIVDPDQRRAESNPELDAGRPPRMPPSPVEIAPPVPNSLGLGSDVDEDEVVMPSDYDLTAEDLQHYLDSKIEFEVDGKSNRVRIKYKTYAACADRLSFPDERKAVYSKDHAAALFRIRDNGFIQCMKQYEGKGKNGGWPTCKQNMAPASQSAKIKDICKEVNKTVNLAGLNVPGDVEKIAVKLAWRDSGCASFSDVNCIKGTHTVAPDITTAEMLAAKKRLDENHKLEASLRAMLAGTATADKNKFAEASERLRADSAVDEEVLYKWERDFAKILKMEEEKKTRDRIAELTREGHASGAVDGVAEELVQIASAHPERTKDVAAALKNIAQSQSELRDEETGNVIGNPQAVLDKLKDINEYNADAKRLSREYRLSKYDDYTPESYRDFSTVNKDLRALEKDAYKTYYRACNQNRPHGASLEACAAAQDEIQRIQQIRITAYQNLAGVGSNQMGGYSPMNAMAGGGIYGGAMMMPNAYGQVGMAGPGMMMAPQMPAGAGFTPNYGMNAYVAASPNANYGSGGFPNMSYNSRPVVTSGAPQAQPQPVLQQRPMTTLNRGV